MVSSTQWLLLATVAVIIHQIYKFTSRKDDYDEPPVLRPRVPFIGHIIGLMKHEASYFSILRTRTNNSVITMPMLNQQTYFIFSPFLAQQAMRNRNLDFDLVGMAFARSVAAISDQAMSERIKKGPNTYTTETVAAIKSSLTGQGLHRMNAAMLSYVAAQLNGIDASDGLKVPSLWLWMRDMMTMATVEAFYGHQNPFRQDKEGLDALWDFDEALPAMLFLPSALARAGARHRDRIVQTLRPYFDGRKDRNEDVSEFVASRTEVSYRYNVLGDDLCKGEVINIWVSTANSIPALFWTFINVWIRPSIVANLRHELLPLVTFTEQDGKRKATLDIRSLEKQCPLLVSCQREGVRVANHMVARRAITADTTLTDEDGSTYLLRKGTDIMWSAKIAHELKDVWGADALEFDPERFMKNAKRDAERKQRAAYMPFGGGAHLCPGRNFAFAEILGLISALVLGYEIDGLQVDKIEMGPRELASAIPKPAVDGDGGQVTIRRRHGWEDVHWVYAC